MHNHYLMKMHASQKIQQLLQIITRVFQNALKDNLIGVYLHGSLAMGCFNPKSSDIDFLVIVKRELSTKIKKKIIKKTLDLCQSEKMTSKGLEFSVVLKKYLDHFVFPTPFELHFSNDWKERFATGKIDYSKKDRDPDLAAHFTKTRIRGICLFGEPIKNIFPEIPRKYYLKSIILDSKWNIKNVLNGPDKGTGRVPVYAMLNFCRVLAFMNKGLITSKKEGGEWGLKNLPRRYRPLITEAVKEYKKSGSGETVSAKLLKEFGAYVKSELSKK